MSSPAPFAATGAPAANPTRSDASVAAARFESARLRLRPFEPDAPGDQDFIIALVNDPDWVANIGKRDVSTREQAQAYLRNGPSAMLARTGLALLCVDDLASGAPVGMCGLIKRDSLPDVDIGFAFLPAYRGQGYAREAAAATLAWAQRLGLQRVVAIVTPGNEPSLALLHALGFVREPDVEQNGQMLHLLAWQPPGA